MLSVLILSVMGSSSVKCRHVTVNVDAVLWIFVKIWVSVYLTG